jgi:hypothetical protein
MPKTRTGRVLKPPPLLKKRRPPKRLHRLRKPQSIRLSLALTNI